jgi:TolA-binding protein
MMGRRVLLAGVLAAGLLCTGLAFGDDTKSKSDTGKPAAKASLPPHFKQIGLTEEQHNKVVSVIAEYRSQIEALTKQLNELKEKQHQEIAKLLTEEQKEQLKKIMAANALGNPGSIKKVNPAHTTGDAAEKKEDKKEDKKK